MVPNKDTFWDFNQLLSSPQLCIVVLASSCMCLLLSSCLTLQPLRFVMYVLPVMPFCLHSAIKPNSQYPVWGEVPI